MSGPPAFRSMGARVRHAEPLVAPATSITEILYVHANKTYGLQPDPKAAYNNPVTQEPSRAKESPVVKEMKGQLIESIETLTLSPMATKSPITKLPSLPAVEILVVPLGSPSREILELPSTTTKISPVLEQEAPIMVPTAGAIRAAPATTLVRPAILDINPDKIGRGKGGKGKLYTVAELKNKLRGLSLSPSGSKAVLVNLLVSYIKENDPGLYARLSADVK
uniref:SAP domain protein n=1 Tax=Pithovirus LCPAC103 TaxID=2506588 RepID=A0A481Z3F9_9VIRU|nr:MAG: SAP domain protein [Pithovirus LCPAC103]